MQDGHVDITGIDKEGWHYMWVVYEDATDENKLIKRPKYVFIEEVYYYEDFSLLEV